MDNQNYLEFCKYVQPIISGCAGFIRTDGFVTHIPGVIVMMSADEAFVNIIRIPIIFDIRLTTSINKLLGVNIKDRESIDDLFKEVYFTGYNIKEINALRYLQYYSLIDSIPCIYSEDNCMNIEGFETIIKNIDITNINVSDGIHNYRVPASKSITNASKSDNVSLKIYRYILDPMNEDIRTIRYSIYKKKFKLVSEVFANILVI